MPSSWIETPARQPRPRVEGAHRAGRRLDAAIIGNRGADNDDADDHRGRRDLEFAGPFQRTAGLNLTSPVVPKSAQRMPVFASSAITRTSLVPMKIRARRAAVSGPVIDPIGHPAAISDWRGWLVEIFGSWRISVRRCRDRARRLRWGEQKIRLSSTNSGVA
jgi:hypothetical protein